jgi:hypothetical protein
VGVLIEVLVVEGSEVVGVFGLVLLDIGLINPEERVHEPGTRVSFIVGLVSEVCLHAVQCGRDVTHHGHEEEWDL